MTDLPEWAAEAVHVNTTVLFDWRDRIRVLLGRPVHVDSQIDCEHKPGRTSGAGTRVWVERVFPVTPMMAMATCEGAQDTTQ